MLFISAEIKKNGVKAGILCHLINFGWINSKPGRMNEISEDEKVFSIEDVAEPDNIEDVI